MRVIFVLLLFILPIYSQAYQGLGNEELDDPDESQLMEQILTRIFQRIDLETADSSALVARGYSSPGIESILTWQQKAEGMRSKSRLRKQLHDEDLLLLRYDLAGESEKFQMQLRQRLQYSPSQSGWRVLNKGRMWNQWGSLNLLLEQDPRENQFTDHTVFTLNIDAFRAVQNLILGDFHVNWGAGLILNQQGSRLNLNPGSLRHGKVLNMRPHYSSRETDYFHGIATQFSYRNMDLAAFASNRNLLGTVKDGTFKEDADGIHPSGRAYDITRRKTLGLAAQLNIAKFQFYGATVLDNQTAIENKYEFGLSGSFANSQQIQIFSDGFRPDNSRCLVTWVYSTKPFTMSLQFRRYPQESRSGTGSIPAVLGSSSSNEKGLSWRIQIRPTRTIRIRYALETGHPMRLPSLTDLRSIQLHKIQVFKRLNNGSCQLDWSRKMEHSLVEGDIWDAKLIQLKTSKAAVSVLHRFSPALQYRINVKGAWNESQDAFVIQQRLSSRTSTINWSIGYSRYMIYDASLRLSIYETSVVESYSFYTCYDDGERWFLYLKQNSLDWIDLELKLDQTHSFDPLSAEKQLALSFQMSIVL